MSYMGVVRPTIALTSSDIADDAVTTAKINDDAVTDAKLANSINTDISANTAKVTNATHTGDVTGATALTIATDAVDIAMLSATGTADATTLLRGDNSWVVPTGGLYESYAVIGDQKASGVSMQTVTSGAWRTRDLNTEVFDPDGIVSISSNQFTLGAGTYFIRATIQVTKGTNQSTRLYDITNTAVKDYGGATYIDGVHNFPMQLPLCSRISPSGSTVYEIQQIVTGTATPGSNSDHSVQWYMYVEIFKEA